VNVPLSVYVHFPWCVSKCPYCDFNSHALRDALPEEPYLESLNADLAAQAQRFSGRRVDSVFLGGGTPSLFSPPLIARVLRLLRQHLSMAPDAEITLEANPATVERGRFAGYRDAGIIRVSLGAQSFDRTALAALGRIHVPADVARAAEELHASGLSNFNLDLMYGLPAQDVAGAMADVTAALALEPAHLSHYQLTLEPGTQFAAQPPELPDEEACWQMQVECQGLLAAHGYAQYEVSAYARAGRQCRHNLNYWSFGDYVGVGAGAHGKLTLESPVRILRSTHLREPRRYATSASQGPQWREVPPAEAPFEFMLNALRLNAGFTAALFESHTGQSFATVQPTLVSLVDRGLIRRSGEAWQATALGQRFLNDLVSAFLPHPESAERAVS
jgi:putative oxygen-independent coproporphyrinogen III oxidase